MSTRPRRKSPHFVSAEVADAVGIPLYKLRELIKAKKIPIPDRNPHSNYFEWTEEHLTELRRLWKEEKAS